MGTGNVKSIATTYVELAERISTRLVSPRIRALHLPPKEKIAGNHAEFCALELEDGSIGFSFILMGDTERRLHASVSSDVYTGLDALVLARGYAQADPVAKAIGFAAINALSQSLFSRANWVPQPSSDSLGQLEPRNGEHIGMIGLFSPLVARVSEVHARLTVLELRPELAGEHGDYRVTLDPADLAGCEKVVSTCAVMLNDTLDAVLDACQGARYRAMIGPTAGCVPDPLFDRGLDHLGGRRVVDVEGFRDAFRDGKKWGSFCYKYAISRQEYPGIDALLAQAS
jgi:uncharacterized protein (DUF4213/DUF364 family)